MPDEVRRFLLPWSIGENDACFWIEDAEGKHLAYIYFDYRPSGIGTASTSRPTRAEARETCGVAMVPELLNTSWRARSDTPARS